MLKRQSRAPDLGEETSHVQRVLYVIVSMTLLASGLIAAVGFLTGGRISTTVGPALFAVSLVLLWLTWQQRLTLPRFLMPLLGFGVAVLLVRLTAGIRDEAMLLFPLAIVMAGLLLGKSGLIIYTVLCVIAVTVQVVSESNGWVVTAYSEDTNLASAVTLTIFLGLTGVLLYVTINDLSRSLSQLRRNERDLAASNRELQAARASLEQRVEERTRELARRTQYLEAAAAIAREAAAVLALQELLERVAGLVRERFALHSAGIYLKDATGEWAVLRAVSTLAASTRSMPGQRLLLQDPALVSSAIRLGESRVRSDATPLPDLPGARAEAALPLMARGQTIGALDLHSDQPHAFQPQDLAALRTLADQIALAINNAQLFEQTQASLEAERRAYSQQAGEAWQGLVQANANLGFLFQQGKLARLDSQPATPPHSDGRLEYKLPELELPITVRGGVIGTLDAHKPADAGEWTAEEIALVESLTEQLGVALDSARLYQDTQRRAAQERVVGEITARMRESLDLETVLKTAADQIWGTLGMSKVTVRLVSEK